MIIFPDIFDIIFFFSTKNLENVFIIVINSEIYKIEYVSLLIAIVTQIKA